MDHVENAMDHVSPWATAPKLPSTHYVDNRIYTDPVIFEEERENPGCNVAACLSRIGTARTRRLPGEGNRRGTGCHPAQRGPVDYGVL